MARMGTAEITLRVDPSSVLAIADAITMLCALLHDAGHVLTPEQQATLDRAVEACEPQHLVAEAS